MRALFIKELNGFFNSLIAYVVMAAFLLITGLFLWVFPAGYNILDGGYANLDGLFVVAPFVFVFLVPAITMRLFADEKRTGTMEMLLTKPLSVFQVVFVKYLAGATLVVVSLLPTLVYVATLHGFAAAPGVDFGGIWGSYAGLLFLGLVFVAIGLFSSALTENQIVSFVIALFLSGFLFIGFEMLHGLPFFGQYDLFVRDLGLYPHYSSMGRGVLDSRNALYFAGVIAIFLGLAHMQFQRRKPGGRWWFGRFATLLALVVFANVFGSFRFVRLDLTSARRYSLTAATRAMLGELDDHVYFRVYLEGDLPAEFRRLRNDTREMLDEFAAYSDHILYDFIHPAGKAGDDAEDLQREYRSLAAKGLEPAQIQMRAGDGSSQRVIFPGAIISYGDREAAIQLLQDHQGLPVRDILHNSSMQLEYNLASAIRHLTASEKKRIAFLEGNGQLDQRQVASISRKLERFYEVDRVDPGSDPHDLSTYHALISANPTKPFSEEQKYVLDQYLMHGGRMLWLVDRVFADMDSLRTHPETVGVARDINLDDFFFHYGARLNPVLIKDLHAAVHPIITGYVGGSPQINLLPWYFFPLVTPVSDHAVVKNVNTIRTEFVSSMDTVEVPGVDKHVLLQTSPYTRVMPVPVPISLDILRRPVDESLYTGPPETIALLLEGRFPSLFANRVAPLRDLPSGWNRKDRGEPAAMIVVADGSVIRNQFGSDGRPLPLGYDRFSQQTFGNEDFIMNAVNYLNDDAGLMEARAKDVRLRLLDDNRVKQHARAIQVANVGLPVLAVLAFGAFRLLYRKRKYSR